MNFSLIQTIDILKRTPSVIENLLLNISDEWSMNNEGPETFSPFDVIGHLIHGEKTDWVVRMEIILSDRADKSFESYDRFAQFKESKGMSLADLISEFKKLRSENLRKLKSKNLIEADFKKTGIHPKFGSVTLRQLLSTWAVHDLSHLAQIARVMSKQYKVEVGPWIEYLPILTRK